MKALLFLLFVPWMLFDLVGALVVHSPLLGFLALAALAALAWAGVRLWKDERLPRLARRLALAAGALFALALCASILFVFVTASMIGWEDWHHSGAGTSPGMSVAEARAAMGRRARIEETGVASDLLLYPRGLASLHLGMMDVYGVHLSTAPDGKLTAVYPWKD
ncbi:MAG: hypothetical protein WC969_00660 [Elusimicrobiota bacterium]|jgi:hypothetical protein